MPLPSRQRKERRRGRQEGSPGRSRSLCVVLPRLHAAQQLIVAQARRYNVVCLGRRAGKTCLGIDRLVQPALHGAPVAWMSPTYRMLAEVWRTVRHRLGPLVERISEQHYRMELVTGGVVEMWSLDHADAIRGRKYRRVVIDEAAMVRDLGVVWQQVVRPTLTDLCGDAWLLSSPRGRNFFWECFQRGEDPQQTEWRSWQMPTSANPYVSPREIEAMRRELPERVFQQEVLARFLDGGAGVFRRVQEAATAHPLDGPAAGAAYVVGCDWARAVGGDYTVLTVMDSVRKTVVALDRFSGVDYGMQVGRLRALCERWNPQVVYSEMNNMGGPLTELLGREGLPVHGVTTTNPSKARWVDALALAFERDEITILDDPVLVGELLAYEGTLLPGGGTRYSAPPGGHDDCVMSLMLAWQGCGQGETLVWT
jgi:hypothetical protein